MMTNLLLLLGLAATCSAVAHSYFRTDRELEPFQEHQVKQPVLGSGRSQDCKWTKEGEIINQQKFTGDYVNMGLEKVLDGTWQCVLRIVRVTEEADNGKMFSLEFKDQVYQVTTYVDAETLPAVVEEKQPNKLDEMTQSMLTIVYIAVGVFVVGSVIFFGLLKCT